MDNIVKPNESLDNNTAYMIQYTKIDKFAIYLPIALKIINSFRFIDKYGAIHLWPSTIIEFIF